MDVLIVKHIDIEGPGLIEDCLKQEKIPYRIISLKPGIRFPLLDDLSHVVLLGGPMNVYEEDRYPFLKDEDLFIKEAIQRGKLILGICLGAQLIATSASIPHQAFRYGEHAYGLQFHLEVTEEMIRDWMEAYEDEFSAGDRARFSQEEILKDTEEKIAAYLRQGRDFITRFIGLGQRREQSI